MLPVKALSPVQIQVPEHRTILHIVPIDDKICARRVHIRHAPHIQASIFAVIAVKIVVQIIFVVLTLHNGIINDHALYGEPPCQVMVLLIQCRVLFQKGLLRLRGQFLNRLACFLRHTAVLRNR